MGQDEEATLRTLSSHRKFIDSLIEQHRGRFVNSAGDSVLAEFASVLNAVQCAVEVQRGYLWNRLTVHYTPKHGSWLNQAQIEISLFARQCLGQRRIPSLLLLRSETRAWNRTVNRNKVIIDWRFTRMKERQKVNYDKNSFMRL